MNTKSTLRMLAHAALLLVSINFQVSTARAQGTAFTYQGLLKTASGPANGSYDLTFTLYNTNAMGAPVSGTVAPGCVALLTSPGTMFPWSRSRKRDSLF